MVARASRPKDFEVVACHGDHAGKAHLTIRACDGGAEIAIRHMPFAADAGQTVTEEQAQILAHAAELAREAAAFLAAETSQLHAWPTSPADGEAPKAFGQPIPPR